MIVLVTGPPGAGKSAHTTRKIAQALADGKCVATNVELTPGWARTVARSNLVRRLIPGRCNHVEARLRRSVHVTPDLDELFAIRLAGSKEGRGVMVVDEAQLLLNSRSWNDGTRLGAIRFFSQHRKLGWDVYLIAQDAEMIDKQVRALFEYHAQLRNLRKVKLLGIPIVPCNLFLAVWTWHAARGLIVRRETFLLGWWKGLYSTMATHGGLDDEPDRPRLTLPIAQPAS